MTHPLNEALVNACRAGDIAEMERLAAAGAEIDTLGSQSPVIQAACKGQTAAVAWLLEKGAPVEGRDTESKWTPLQCAAYYGFLDAVRLLLEHGANPALKNAQGKDARTCAREQNMMDVLRYFDRNPDQVSFSWPLDNRIMQEVYHFPRRERISLIRKTEGGEVEAMQRESFAALEDKSGLRKAFEEHRKLGGRLEEGDVFPDALRKPKLTLRP
jgi:hypothetical protein